MFLSMAIIYRVLNIKHEGNLKTEDYLLILTTVGQKLKTIFFSNLAF